MYTVFTHAVFRSYRADVFSKATVFYVAASLLTFVPPLLIAYRSQGNRQSICFNRYFILTPFFKHSGFWRRVDVYREQPDVHFKHDILVSMDTQDPDGFVGWSTYNNFNQIIGDRARVPLVKVKL